MLLTNKNQTGESRGSLGKSSEAYCLAKMKKTSMCAEAKAALAGAWTSFDLGVARRPLLGGFKGQPQGKQYMRCCQTFFVGFKGRPKGKHTFSGGKNRQTVCVCVLLRYPCLQGGDLCPPTLFEGVFRSKT